MSSIKSPLNQRTFKPKNQQQHQLEDKSSLQQQKVVQQSQLSDLNSKLRRGSKQEAEENVQVTKNNDELVDDHVQANLDEIEQIKTNLSEEELAAVVRIKGIIIAEPRDKNVKAISLEVVHSLYPDEEVYVMITERRKRERSYEETKQIVHDRTLYQRVDNRQVSKYDFIMNDEKRTKHTGVNEARTTALASFPGLKNMIHSLVLSIGHDVAQNEEQLVDYKCSIVDNIRNATTFLESLEKFDLTTEDIINRRKAFRMDFVNTHLLGARLKQDRDRPSYMHNIGFGSFTTLEDLPVELKFTDNELTDFHTSPCYNDINLCRNIGKRMIAQSLAYGTKPVIPSIYTFLGFYLYTSSMGLRPALLLLLAKLKQGDQFIFNFTNRMLNDAFYLDQEDGAFIFSLKTSILQGAPPNFVIRPRRVVTRTDEYSLIEEDEDSLFD